MARSGVYETRGCTIFELCSLTENLQLLPVWGISLTHYYERSFTNSN
jgi:hypothetical protein